MRSNLQLICLGALLWVGGLVQDPGNCGIDSFFGHPERSNFTVCRDGRPFPIQGFKNAEPSIDVIDANTVLDPANINGGAQRLGRGVRANMQKDRCLYLRLIAWISKNNDTLKTALYVMTAEAPLHRQFA